MIIKMVANQTEYSMLEQRSVIKLQLAKEYKSYEIYRRLLTCTKKRALD